MTDKEKQYLIAEIERLKDCASPIVICDTLLSFIDSMQEEPVSKQNLSNVKRTIKDWKEPVSGNIDFEQELYKAFGQIKDFTLGIAIAKRFYDMGRKHNEPVSEELEEAGKQYLERSNPDRVHQITNAFKAGANWQKEQFEKNRLKHCNSITNEQAELEQGFIDQHLDKYQRMPTFLDAIEYGMRLQQEQMMANATEVTVHIEVGNYPYIPQIELYDYDKDIPLAKEGDKYKVVLIKED